MPQWKIFICQRCGHRKIALIARGGTLCSMCTLPPYRHLGAMVVEGWVL